MTILGVEFSSPQRSVALRRGETLVEAQEMGGRQTAALAMIEKVLAEADTSRTAVDTLVVGLGPGSYTGIRAAIALAQGWQLASGVKLLGVSSVEAIIARAQAEGLTGQVSVVIDAQRTEFYLATYAVTAAGWTEFEPLHIVPLAEIQARAANGALLVGPEIDRWIPGGRVIFPSAAILAELAGPRKDFLPGEKLEPIYLRETTFVKAPPSRVIVAPVVQGDSSR